MANSTRKHCLLLLFFGLIILAAGCGETVTGEVASITVSPSTATVGVNQTQAFSAIGRDSAGLLVNVSPAWSVTGGIGTITSTGLFTAGAAESSGTIIATVGSLTGSSPVSITVNGNISGVVSSASDGGLLEGVRVYLKEATSLGTSTDSLGKYTISNVPPATYEVDIDANPSQGILAAASQEVTVTPGAQLTGVDFSLLTPTTVTTSTTLPLGVTL